MKILEERLKFSKKPIIISTLNDERFEVKDLAEFYNIGVEDEIIINGKIDMVLSEGTDFLLYVRPQGLFVLRIAIEDIERAINIPDTTSTSILNQNQTIAKIKHCITNGKEIFIRKDDEYIYFILRKNNNKYSKERFEKIINFFKDSKAFEKIKPIEQFPQETLARTSNGNVKIINEEYLNAKYIEATEKLIKHAEKNLETESMELISLAPPKDGHILQLIAAGAANGRYGNFLVKGKTEVLEVEEYEDEEHPEEGKYLVQVPKIKLLALDLISKELFEIV